MKTFSYELTEPIEYSVKGEQAFGSSITFYAPKPVQRKKTTKLKQMFFQSLPKSDGTRPEQTQKDETPEVTGDAILGLIASSNTDYSEFIELGRSLICDKNAKIDDVEFLTTALVDRIDIDSLEEMIGQYVANFIVRSALKSLGKS